MRERSEAMDPSVVRVYDESMSLSLGLAFAFNQWFFGAFRFSIHSAYIDLDLPMNIVRLEMTEY